VDGLVLGGSESDFGNEPEMKMRNEVRITEKIRHPRRVSIVLSAQTSAASQGFAPTAVVKSPTYVKELA